MFFNLSHNSSLKNIVLIILYIFVELADSFLSITRRSMKTKFKSIFSFLSILLIFASCSKEYSYEALIDYGSNSGTAVYDYSGAPGNCTTPIITGTYTVGTPITADNYVVLQVTVTTPGNYLISTANINGIIFSGSGVFVSTGLQAITLTGTGTPLVSGAFSYVPGNNGCSFVIVAVTAPPLPDNFVKCKIDGVSTNFNVEAKASESTTAASPPIPMIMSVDISGNISNSSFENFFISLNKFNTAIVTGDVFDTNSIINGNLYLVSYTDPSGVSWDGYSGVAETPFKITVTSKTATRITGTFNGTLSDTGLPGGNLKLITEGSFSVPIQ